MFRYLKHLELPYHEGDHTWTISSISGSLIRSQSKGSKKESTHQRVADALIYCNNPYLLKPCPTNYIDTNVSKTTIEKLDRMHRRLLLIGNHHFYLSRLYASFSENIFENTTDAISAISQLPVQKDHSHQLCLQRTLLAAKISRSFKDKGILFIGSSIPSVEMHAWIIDDGYQPDNYDRYWINFRPMLALYND
jgi:hypothetical protein